MVYPPQAHLFDLSFRRRRESKLISRRISLDTRFRGYDGHWWPLRGANHPRTYIFEGGTKDTQSPKDDEIMRNDLEDKCVEVRLKAQKFAEKVLQ
jgi:hypothetical protein